MTRVNPESLSATLDAVNAAFVDGKTLSKTQRLDAAKWIAARLELRHAPPAGERFVKGRAVEGEIDRRRGVLVQRVLERA
ncbi:MAG TPA: hypothetical protein P5137_03140 [Candidatus Brocadiia bacterium]|nr:hypothetical protein [Candidatus Brocadiia bacterium]